MADTEISNVAIDVQVESNDPAPEKADTPAPEPEAEAADPMPAPVQAEAKPEATAPAPAADPAPAAAPKVEAAPVAEDPVPEAFADLYAASSQAFANSRALKAQKEIELEVLERTLPEAESDRVAAVKSADELVSVAQTRSATMVRDADAEVARIKDAIATKQLEIEKAEAADVEKAEALVAILNSYITRRSG